MGKAANVEVFISHSSKDADAATAVAELLDGAIDNLGLIRCTSAFGHGLDIGSNVAKKLRKEIDGCDVFLALISNNSLSSQFCLFEMGAAWGMKIPIAPILTRDFDASRLKPPLTDLHCLKWQSEDGWQDLIRSVAKLTKSDRKHSGVRDAAVRKICAWKPARASQAARRG